MSSSEKGQALDAMRDYMETNRQRWDELTHIHGGSEYYDVEGFKAGTITIPKHEIEEIGDVTGKDLLHLMCHFGLDTLSWARLGARAVGMDYSGDAISLARSIADEVGLDARFVESDVYELPNNLQGEFDIVYTSSGVLSWLPDLPRWGEVIAHFLRPGGFFYISEIHPIAHAFDDQETDKLLLGYPYFHRTEPLMFVSKGTYADPTVRVEHPLEFSWIHDMADIVDSLIGAGLRIDFLHEFPFTDWAKSFLVQSEDGFWRLPPERGEIPLSFTLKATKTS